jgi:acyl-CoA thioesterase-2
MPTALEALIELLDLEEIELNLFRGRSPAEDRQRVFGGQVLAQALVAAYRTVEDRLAHSFHAYFLRPGDTQVPILYEVDRIRDGGSFTTRRVEAIQHGRPIFHLTASFQTEQEGYEHQASMPEAPHPDELPTIEEQREKLRSEAPPEMAQWFEREHSIDERSADPIHWFRPEKLPPYQRVWVRTNGALPDDPRLQQAVLAYLSDMSLLDTVTMPHAITFFDEEMQIASLDHAMWFHRPFRADEWLLYVSESPSASNTRGLARGNIFRQDGTLVASVAQEGLIRRRKPVVS